MKINSDREETWMMYALNNDNEVECMRTFISRGCFVSKLSLYDMLLLSINVARWFEFVERKKNI